MPGSLEAKRTASVRLHKFLSMAGVCSRRRGEALIAAGRVKVNGRVQTEPGIKVDPARDRVEVDGILVKASEEPIYIALNKPAGYVTSCRQPRDRIVLELVDVPERVYPVGRLTNDGRLHHRLSHPSFDHEKEYEVEVDRPISDGALGRMARGLPVLGTKTRPARVRRLASKRFRIVLQEGRNRQIRRMLRKLGCRVVQLKRIRVAHIRLGRLAEGAWRYLDDSEKETLLRSVTSGSGPFQRAGRPEEEESG
jgi:pseudouridine synthase